ncbi:MAG: pseudaminic acid synthase [Patescibacteria group bacterium]
MTQEIAHLNIDGRLVGLGQPVFIVAELSGNHNQSLERAKELIKAAADCGVDAVKLQTYTPDTMTIDSAEESFKVKGSSVWAGKTLYQLYETAHTPWEWFDDLRKVADGCGIILFSAPFDITAVDLLESKRAPVYKIASFEAVDIELLKRVAKTGKPVIVSRGMASLEEIELAVSTLRENGAGAIAVLQCVISYPAKPEETNLATMADIRERFKVVVGLSDHSLTVSIPTAAAALGASIIEKHFTLSRADGGPDCAFSLEPAGLKEMVKLVREAEKAVGNVQYGVYDSEAENMIFRRSLFVVQDIKAGDVFTRENVRSIRPGNGLLPKFLPEILGKKAKSDIKKGTPLKQELIQ